eukprot:3350663-Amphidinium_carterae.1
MPMGWSHAVYYCQQAVLGVSSACGVPATIITDSGLFCDLSGSKLGLAVYVDNVLVFGTNSEMVTSGINKISSALNKEGLVVHGPEPASSSSEFLGLALKDNKLM